MKAITIQRVEILLELERKGVFFTDNLNTVPRHLLKAYKYLMKEYGYQHRPFFLCPIGRYANFSGADDSEENVVLQFDIPEDEYKIQSFYDWSDFIFWIEDESSYAPVYNCETVEDYGKTILNLNNTGFNQGKDVAYQLTTQQLKYKWLEAKTRLTPEFIEEYYDNGGVSILKPL